MPVARPALERFWEKVDTSAGPDECWPWTAGVNPDTGYGVFHPRHGYTVLAHRFSATLAGVIGDIKDPLHVDHTCHNGQGCPPGPCPHRLCQNPAHLEGVTNAENVNRSHNSNIQKTHCPAGHEYQPETTRIHPNGGRSCKICAAGRNRKRVR